MKKITILFLLYTSQHYLYSQERPSLLFDVIMNGYIFNMNGSVFFQPLSFNDKSAFLNSFDKNSFLIQRNQNLDIVDITEKTGNKLYVKKFFQDSLDKSGNNFDTVYYFKTILKAEIIYDSDRTKISPIGFGFIIKDSLYSFGNLFTTVRVAWISPYDDTIRIQLANNYRKKFGWVPVWLKKRKIIYNE